MGLNAELPVMLTTLTLPLTQVRDFIVGQAISLGQVDFDSIRVVTCQGQVLARGSLGKCKDQRAVRLVARKSITHTPARRASDRPNLDLPALETSRFADLGGGPDPDSFEAVLSTDTTTLDLPDLPDMSDLPDFADLPELT